MSTETPTPEAHTATPVPTPPPAPAGATPDEPLGAPGLAALKSEREAKAAAEKRAAEAEARLKEIEDRDKSEAQKQQEALEKAKQELAELTAAKTRVEVANTKGVPVELIAGPASSSQKDLEAFADALIAYKGEPQLPKLHVPNITKSPSQQADNEFVRQLFGKE